MLVPILVAMAVVYAVSRLIYWFVIDREVPGGWDRRFGVREPLPPDVGKWTLDNESPEGEAASRSGTQREVRLFYDPHRRGTKLVRQVRYRSITTNAIVR